MAANCKVVPLVWNWVNKLSLGLTSVEIDLQLLIDEFNVASGCKEVIPCSQEGLEDCNSGTEVVFCNFIIGTIDYATDPTGRTTIGAPITRYLGGTGPFFIEWTWDPLVFSYIVGQGTQSIVLQKLDTVPPGATSTVSVRANDANQCKDAGAVTVDFPEAVIDCNMVMAPPASYIGLPYTGTITVPYGGGNGKPHEGMIVASSGVAGLTATLLPGTLATGDGALTFNVVGVPQGNGPASFTFDLFGTECVFNFQVAQTICQPTQISHVYHPYDFDNNWYPVEILWIPNPNATSYKLEIQFSIGAPQVVIVPAPASSTFIFVPALMFYGVQLTVTCLFDSSPVGFVDTAPGVPAPCPQPTNMTASVTGWDPVLLKWSILVRWDIMTGATSYIFRDVATGQSFVQGGRTRSVQKDSNGSWQFGATVDCGDLAGLSPESLVSVNTPAIPTAGPPANWPQIHYIDNVSTQLLNSWFMQMWITVDGDSDYVEVMQRSPFYIPPPGGPQFTANSGVLVLGADNGFGTLPPGFGPNDIFFGTPTPPKGVTLPGSALNFVRVAVVKGTGAAFQGWATYFDYWMNVPEQYTVRMSNEDYISTDPSFNPIRPNFVFFQPNPGELNVTLNPKPVLNYDACSRYNLFLVAETGGIYTKSQSGLSMTQTFTGLAPGRYMLFGEHSYNACSVPGNVTTAIPVMVTIT